MGMKASHEAAQLDKMKMSLSEMKCENVWPRESRT